MFYESCYMKYILNRQRSLKRLIDQHIISQLEKGKYTIEKPGLTHYLIEHEESE